MILILISTLLFGIAIGLMQSVKNIKTIQDYDDLADDLAIRFIYLIIAGTVLLIVGGISLIWS